jgi:NAD(P)-dependent dehydrogenase (short-subunit alcohol dehydrogenase family)
MARGFAEAGADVVICSRHEDELNAARREISDGLSICAKAFVVDMCDRRQVEKLAADAVAEMGRVDILVNNAGSNVPQSFEEMTEEGWDRIVELNLTSCIFLTKALVPQMIERGWGRVIHIASIMGLGSKEARHSYSGTKAALIGEARSAAIELGPHGITVNCLAPGPFLTDLPGTLLSDEEKKTFADRTALGRWGDPKELAGPALLLASEAGSYITGETLVVDGGAVCRLF